LSRNLKNAPVRAARVQKTYLLPRISKFKLFSPRKQFTVAALQQRRMHVSAIASVSGDAPIHYAHTRRFMALYINSKDARVLV
jgi:hypothetical protein